LRFLLAFIKVNPRQTKIILSKIPYINFDLDEYKYFELSKEEIEFIEEFINDYF